MLSEWFRRLSNALGFAQTTSATSSSDLNVLSTQLSKPVSFSYEVEPSKVFGQVARPVAWVDFYSELDASWSSHKMLVDTGADLTLLPRYMAALLGLELDGAKLQPTLGFGGQQDIHLIEDVKVRLGSVERLIPVGVASTNKIPLLLGRQLFLETFVTRFEKDQRVVFEE